MEGAPDNKIEQLNRSLEEIENSIWRLQTLALNSLSPEKQTQLGLDLDQINIKFAELEKNIGLEKNPGRETMRGWKNR